MINKIKQIIENHKFFVRESRLFVGKLPNKLIRFELNNSEHIEAKFYKISLKDKVYYPIAYIKFMVACLKDLK